MTTAPANPPTETPSTAPFTRQDIELSTRAVDLFTRLYYTAYDSDKRRVELPKFYRPTSSIVWNGKPLQGVDGLMELIGEMPKTKHEVQSFDCHPIPGTSPPSLLVTVSGNVTHGRGPAGNPPKTHSKNIEGHPRVFSQTFLLVPDSGASKVVGEVAKYYVKSDSIRFVG